MKAAAKAGDGEDGSGEERSFAALPSKIGASRMTA
jgi:hypothetical protein